MVNVRAVIVVLAVTLALASAKPTTAADGNIKIVKINHIQDENSYQLE